MHKDKDGCAYLKLKQIKKDDGDGDDLWKHEGKTLVIASSPKAGILINCTYTVEVIFF